MPKTKKVVEETVEEVVKPAETPKKTTRGRKKKESTTTVSSIVETKKNVENGGWNSTKITQDDQHETMKHNFYVEIELISDALGMMPSSNQLYADYIASKAPDKETMEQEIAEFGKEEFLRQQTTIWPRAWFKYDEERDVMIDLYMDRNVQANHDQLQQCVFLFDYQWKGWAKDACGGLARGKNNLSSELRAYKKVIDTNFIVFPRHVAFTVPDIYIDEYGNEQKTRDENGMLKILQRPLRISGPNGDRSAISSSEIIPAGSRCKVRFSMTSELLEPVLVEWLNYGLVRGLAQWRNSGMGRFRWRQLGADWLPLYPEKGEKKSIYSPIK